MVYGSIPDVRGLAGILHEYKHAVKLGTGDGSETEFELPAVGRHRGYIIDTAGVTTSTITTADIVVYVDETPVTVSSIDEDKGTVTLAVAPANATTVTADYMWSEVSDAQILEAMNIAQAQVDKIIRGNNTGSVSKTDTIDGDGETREYEFEASDVTSITSVTVDGASLTETTHYHLYKYPNSDYYWKIVFETPPINDFRNIVIVYDHGQSSDYLVNHLSNLLASRIVVLQYVRSSKQSGQYVRGKNQTAVGNTTRLVDINKQIMDIVKDVDRRLKYRLAM